MTNYKLIIKINKSFKTAACSDKWMAEFLYNSAVSECVKRTKTAECCGEEPHIILANTDNETIIKECLVSDGVIFEQ